MSNKLISLIEKKDFKKMFENYISLILGYDLKKLKYQPDYRYLGEDNSHFFRVCFHIGNDDLYFRFGQFELPESEEKSIVVARIGFERTKNGNGTALLSALADFAVEYNYSGIFIESPNDDCVNFAHKLGFNQHKGNPLYITVEDLKKCLAERNKS